MKLKLYEKLTIWTLSFFIVVSFLFVQVKFDFSRLDDLNEITIYNHTIDTEPMFKLIDVVSVQPNQEMFEEVEASLLLTVIGYVALSVFASLGAYYTSEFILANTNLFTQWYVDWYNTVPTLENGQTAEEIANWQKAQQIPTYLQNTGQLNNDGTLKNETVVLPEDYLKSVYDTAKFYVNDYVDAGGIKWSKLKFENVTPSYYLYLANVQGTPSYKSNLQYLALNQTRESWIINSNILKYTITKIPKSSTISRLKLEVFNKSTNALITTMYSKDLTEEESHIYGMNNGVILSLQKHLSFAFWNWTLTPLYFASSWETSISRNLEFNYSSLTSTTTVNGINQLNNWRIPSQDLSGSFDEEIILENGFPTNWDVEDGNYYTVPIVSNPGDTNTTPPVITPVPIEDEDPYVYTPPTVNPGSAEWTDLVNPSTPAPTATAENTLNGGIFQMLGDWFVSVFYGAINAVMSFFKAVLNNMSTMISDLFDWWKQLIPDTWFDSYWTDFADSMVSLIIPTDLEQQFLDFQLYFENKFGLLIYPIELIFDTFNRFATIQPNQCLIFNGYSDPVQNMQIIKPFTFCFDDFAEEHNIEWMFIMLQVFMNALIVYAFAMGWFKSYESIRDQ